MQHPTQPSPFSLPATPQLPGGANIAQAARHLDAIEAAARRERLLAQFTAAALTGLLAGHACTDPKKFGVAAVALGASTLRALDAELRGEV